jgi:hypothetical protein
MLTSFFRNSFFRIALVAFAQTLAADVPDVRVAGLPANVTNLSCPPLHPQFARRARGVVESFT